ncbi:hypothetical protein A0H81_07280 [Grifola frondosa]|uniref:Myb-like domain-containing protein n=1 Tax=Grifola frondosa TaxID=5627 RepID=A0A1C7M878_GRIFR|nr:hypothetical protein A0H81_07280 [Grifola frondosa]
MPPNTRSSPPQLLVLDSQPIDKSRAKWTEEDEAALIAFLADNKASMSEGSGFKQTIWTVAAAELAKRPYQGAKKMAKMCETKWRRLKDAYTVTSKISSSSMVEHPWCRHHKSR